MSAKKEMMVIIRVATIENEYQRLNELLRDGWLVDWQNSQFKENYIVFRFVDGGAKNE